ncbi:MAG TPA: FkbM family methyltransferase [Bacteroidales bacterium]|nr:FkbM family methyltransferase [Bacteroidales bacterium]
MNRILFQLYRIIVPKPVRTAILKKTLRLKILNYYSSFTDDQLNDDIREVLDWLRNNPLDIFPYDFNREYKKEYIEVHSDPDLKLKYVIHEGNRLYFRRGWSSMRIQRAWSELLREQDIRSPHRYLEDKFVPSPNDVVVDVGAAEGNFALSIIGKVKKIYLFENDRRWVEALKATFAPWKEKVEIINKYAGDKNDSSHVSLDSFFEAHEFPGFIKIDVDGAEDHVLRGCNNIFQSGKPLKVALCTYHRNDDEKIFTTFLENVGFTVTPTRGYMIHYYDKKMKAPYLRRGLLRAVR